MKKPVSVQPTSATPVPQGTLDRIDRGILRELQADGKITNVELAGRVHLSPAACLERVKRLTEQGFVLGYHAKLNPEKLDAGMLVFIEVHLERTSQSVFESFNAAALSREDILECHLIAGHFDYLVKARVRNMRAYREFLGASIWNLPGVRETRTYAVMESVKETMAIAVR
jgi:Lrp/AsnC family transcriptional regulator, leucine-responsive regulatory protein